MKKILLFGAATLVLAGSVAEAQTSPQTIPAATQPNTQAKKAKKKTKVKAGTASQNNPGGAAPAPKNDLGKLAPAPDYTNGNVPDGTAVAPNTKTTPIPNEDLVKKSEPIVETTTNGKVDWTNQYIEATGESVLDNERFKNPAQARAMAIRGAVVVAQRNLLEITKGVNVVGETTVKDMITTNDYVYSRVEGVVKGAQMIGEPIVADGMAKVRLRMPLYANNGLAPALYNNIPPTPEGPANGAQLTAQPAATLTPTGEVPAEEMSEVQKLDFNMTGKKYDPTLFPVVVDMQGNVLLDFKKIYNPATGKFPQIVQATKDIMTQLKYDKGVQVLDAVQSQMGSGKIVLSDVAKSKVNWSKIGETITKVGKFLLMFI